VPLPHIQPLPQNFSLSNLSLVYLFYNNVHVAAPPLTTKKYNQGIKKKYELILLLKYRAVLAKDNKMG
jgi:hypothetical protein